MSAPPSQQGEPITDRRQLVDYIASGSKPRERWRIGTEHEKLIFDRESLRRAPYDGVRASIRALLEGLVKFGWTPVEEGGVPIALTRDKCNVTLEPGGQFELSGAPLETIHQTCDELNSHLSEVKTVCAELGAGMIGLGFDPKWKRADIPWMPKGRYKIMREYMPKRGKLGLDMMTRTCTVQVNLDYASEADMVRTFRVSMALQPVVTALFASSPFTEGRPNGFKSYRSWIWTDTDPDRCGVLPFVFEPGMGFERYVDYLLDVPMYFSYRDGKYIDLAGKSFKKFLAGDLAELPGEKPTLKDWADHMTTAFPEVRLKKYLEMRGADGGRWSRLCALPAFWVGLLYDQTALDAAWDLVKDFTLAERHALRDGVPKHALKLPFRNGTVRDLAREALKISGQGLARRNRLNATGATEAVFIEPLIEYVEANQTPAERKLELFHGPWKGNIDPLFAEFAY